MKHYLVLTCIGLNLAGCSTTYDIPRDPQTEAFTEARESIQGGPVQVTRLDGTEIEMDSASLLSDTLSGFAHQTAEPLAYALLDVEEVAVSNTWRGVGRGALQGSAIGGGLSLVLAAATMERGKWFVAQDENEVARATILGAVSGALIGAIVGAFSFSTYHYLVQHESGPQLGNPELAVPPLHSKVITLKLASFQDETLEAVCIMWNGKRVWLPKSEIKIERDGEYIVLTVPEHFLEAE